MPVILTAAEDLILKAGRVSFHDIRMIHGSSATLTGKRRAAFIMRLTPTTSLYDHALGVEIGEKHSSQGYGVGSPDPARGADRHGRHAVQTR